MNIIHFLTLEEDKKKENKKEEFIQLELHIPQPPPQKKQEEAEEERITIIDIF